MNKKYQVFVSSTFKDLADERQDAIRSILDLGHIPAGMELFPATDTEQLSYIKKIIDECDYYILIVGARYGSLDAEGVSYTEREYDYAVDSGKIVLAFVHDQPDEIPVSKADTAPRLKENLQAFRDKVCSGRIVRFWNNRSSLEASVIKALAKAFADLPAIGWIRGNSAASSDVIEQSNALLTENAKLRADIESLKQTTTPKFDDLAPLGDQTTFKYVYRSSGQYDANSSGSMTWMNIFIGVAGQLDIARTDVAIQMGIRRMAEVLNFPHKIKYLVENDKLRIKAQLEALSLISVRVAKTTNGGVAEFLSLTDYGRRVYLENMISRSSE